MVRAHEVFARTFSATDSGEPVPASNWVTFGCGSVRVPVGLVSRATLEMVIVMAVAAVPPAVHVLTLFSVQFTCARAGTAASARAPHNATKERPRRDRTEILTV